MYLGYAKGYNHINRSYVKARPTALNLCCLKCYFFQKYFLYFLNTSKFKFFLEIRKFLLI
jgi:hypothetical protein